MWIHENASHKYLTEKRKEKSKKTPKPEDFSSFSFLFTYHFSQGPAILIVERKERKKGYFVIADGNWIGRKWASERERESEWVSERATKKRKKKENWKPPYVENRTKMCLWNLYLRIAKGIK